MKFKVGDMVAVYQSGERRVGKIAEVSDHCVWVVSGKDAWQWFHHKQCRRLKKNTRTRLWICTTGGLSITAGRLNEPICFSKPENPHPGLWREFVEVKK